MTATGRSVARKTEAREVLGVVLVEEHVAAEAFAANMLEQPLAPRLELGLWNARD